MRHKNNDTESNRTKKAILFNAGNLFLSQGYNKTTVRQIADVMDTSPGLITYYYPAKKEMAIELEKLQLSCFVRLTHQRVSQKDDPVLFSAVLTKLKWAVMTSPLFRQFHLDCLREGFFYEAAIQSGISTHRCITEKYHLHMSDAELSLYGNYIYSGVAHILALEAEKGNFPLNEIPNAMFKASIGRILNDEELLDRACQEADVIVKQILLEHRELLCGWSSSPESESV